MADAVRVEKLKWDGTTSAAHAGFLVPGSHGAHVWFVPAGTARERPRLETVDVLDHDEICAGVPGEWWVLCGKAPPGGSIARYVLHAAAPFEAPGPGLVRWIDLDLDYDVDGDTVNLDDETQFHENARSMSYPPEVIHGAWEGISRVAPHYTTGDWPFDGWLDVCLATARSLHRSDDQHTP